MKALNGIKVIELAGLAPVPFCGQILADFGASVTLVSKNGVGIEQKLLRGKTQITMDYKKDFGKLRSMIINSDVLLDPFRPGVLEAIGLDPIKLMEENEKLIVARITGYGQTGELSNAPGHDINYVALSGLLPTIAGYNRKPYWPPANLLADFAGGSLTTAFGIVAALVQRNSNGGKGAIIDTSMTEGLAYLGSFISAYRDNDMLWDHEFAAFTGTCPIYRTYETKDGKFMSVGALEPKFNKRLFEKLEIKADFSDIASNPQEIVDKTEKAFKSKTHEEACVTPVLDHFEVGELQQHKDRNAFTKTDGKWLPNPAPKIYSAKEFEELKEKNKKSKL
uniref:Uncharacterized protein n=1 Tax=Panagrolaimus sp. PS1159 TaxID=55785 RepID=A0AC35GGS9_9BILA